MLYQSNFPHVKKAQTAIAVSLIVASAFFGVVVALTSADSHLRSYFRTKPLQKSNQPFGIEAVRRNFDWRRMSEPWLTALVVSAIGVYAGCEIWAAKPKRWPAVAVIVLAIANVALPAIWWSLFTTVNLSQIRSSVLVDYFVLWTTAIVVLATYVAFKYRITESSTN